MIRGNSLLSFGRADGASGASKMGNVEMERTLEALKEQDARMLKRLEEMWGEFVRIERAM